METHLGFWSEIDGNEVVEKRKSDLDLIAMFMRRDHETRYEDWNLRFTTNEFWREKT